MSGSMSALPPDPTAQEPDPFKQERDRLERRILRERTARLEAETLLESKALELFEANEQLRKLASSLEARVNERTRQLQEATELALDLANHDSLTGLANRSQHARKLQEAITEATTTGGRVALLALDLDRFKEINDTFGHDAGDQVLISTALNLSNASGVSDLVSRLGGDEFAIISPDLGTSDDGSRLAETLLRALRSPVNYDGKLLRREASIGLAMFPDHGTDFATLMRNADLALYRSKLEGRCRYTVYDQSMHDELTARRELEAQLRQAFIDRSFEPWFQPIIDLTTLRPIGAEALVRWRRGPDDIVLPERFLSTLDNCGLLPQLFTYMLDASLLAAKPLVDSGLIQHVTVNISARHFTCGTLVEEVRQGIARCDFPAKGLVLEITEDALIEDIEIAGAIIAELGQLGVGVAVDDFGSGYANIGYLRHLPICKLKLDRHLTHDIAEDTRAAAIVSAIVDIARALEVDLITEGVETPEQAAALVRLGCRYAQGYHYARPLPIDDFMIWLTQERLPAPVSALPDRKLAANS